MNHFHVFFLLILLPFSIFSQQTIKGIVIDKDSKKSIPFTTIMIKNSIPKTGTISDENGKFEIQTPINKQTLVFFSVGYETLTIPNINVTAGKEVVLEIELIEKFAQLHEIVLVSKKNKAEKINEFSTVSTHSLNIEETNRYAASLGDPSRQVQNFVGVANGGDDLNNEIVIRGNSPNTLLWRLEGVEIPNPNHFANLGGSAVSMLSSNVLMKSDFFTSAFPAEYGNGIAGVFDLRLRIGNNNKRETTVDAGLLGIGFATEGPFSKKTNASYLVNYRYSTLSILKKMGLNLVGNFEPNYQDLNFNLNFPTSKKGIFNTYGLIGVNHSNAKLTTEESKTLITGLGHRIFLNNKTYLKSNLTFSSEIIKTDHTIDPLLTKELFDSKVETYRFSSFMNHKFNTRHNLRGGFILSNTKEKTMKSYTNDVASFHIENKINGRSIILQSYLQWKYRVTKKITLNSGLHFLHYNLTGKSSIEPRLGLHYKMNHKHAFNFGLGLHSNAERLAIYHLKDQNGDFNNDDLNFSKSIHYVFGYHYKIDKNTRFNMEIYSQKLFDIPVDNSGITGYSSINANLFDFFKISNYPLTNNGKGENYGLEFTIERFLNHGFYYLSTLSLYNSKYSIGNSNDYNTRYNGNYVFNFLSGKEFTLDHKHSKTLGINAKFTLLGGQRYTAINKEASLKHKTTVFSSTPFTEQTKAYFRFDLGVNYQWNKKKTTHKLSMNIQNITNRLNEATPMEYYNNATRTIITNNSKQNGLIPMIKYSVNF